MNTVIANKEYIVSAGAIHTPQILQLSGLSPLEHEITTCIEDFG